MSAEHNKDIARRFHQLFDQGEINAIEALLAPNCIAYQPGTPPLDRENFRQMGLMFSAAFGDSQTLLQDVIANEDTVFCRATWSATHRADFNGIPASGKRITVSVMTMDRIVGGKIVEHWGQPDMLGLLMQLGAVPALA